MSHDPLVDKENYPAGYNAGYIAGQAAERERTKELRRSMSYFLGAAIDYISVIKIDYISVIKGLNTAPTLERMEAFLKELKDNA